LETPVDYLQDLEKFQPMVKSLARKLSPLSGQGRLDLEEVGRAGLSFAVTQKINGTAPAGYTQSKYYWFWIKIEMIDHLRRQERRQKREAPLPINVKAKERNWIHKLISLVGEDAHTILDTVLYTPCELVDEMTLATRGRARMALRAYLRDRMGWDKPRLERAWAEVQEALE
jgi:hypothetical protein